MPRDVVAIETKLVVPLEHSEIQRLLYLVHRDLARVRGNIVMAEEKLEEMKDPNHKAPGRIRKKALQTIATAPEQRAVLEGAQEALQEALRQGREAGLIG